MVLRLEIFLQALGQHIVPCSTKDEIKVTDEQIQSVKEMRWNTFDQFKRRNFAVWIVNQKMVTTGKKESVHVQVSRYIFASI